MAAGIRTRHGRSCRSRRGERCNCQPSYEAFVWSKRDNRKIRRTFQELAEARAQLNDGERLIEPQALDIEGYETQGRSHERQRQKRHARGT